MGSLFAGQQASRQASSANSAINQFGMTALAENQQATNTFNAFEQQMFGQYFGQQPAIDALAGPAVSNFHLGKMPGVLTSPLGDQSKPNVARAWLGGY